MRNLRNSIYELGSTRNEDFCYENYEAKAITVGKTEIEFLVKGNKAQIGVYTDGYLQVKLTNERKKQMENKIKEIYGSETDFVLSYKVNYNYEEFKGLSYIQILSKSQPSIDITCYIFLDEKVDKYEEKEKIFNIIKTYLIDNKIKNYTFDVMIHSKKFKEKYALLELNSAKRAYETLH